MSQADDEEYPSARQRYLTRKPFLISIGKHLTREEIHDRDRARAEVVNRQPESGDEFDQEPGSEH